MGTVSEAPAGKAGDVFTVRYSFKGVDIPKRNDFRANIRVGGITAAKSWSCNGGKSGSFGYVDVDCSVTIIVTSASWRYFSSTRPQSVQFTWVRLAWNMLPRKMRSSVLYILCNNPKDRRFLDTN